MPIAIAGQFVPQNNNTWPLLEDKFVQGGYRIVANEAERLAMNPTSLKVGQKIFQVDTGLEYRILTVDLQSFTDELIPIGGGGEVDPLLLAPAYMGTATSRYDASVHAHSKAWVTSAAKIMGFNLAFARTGTSLVVTQANHNRSVGDRAILRVVDGTQIVGQVTAADGSGFTIAVPDAGPTSGYCSYSLGANFFFYKTDTVTAATGTADIRGVRGSVPTDGEIVVQSIRFRMPANSRDTTNFSYEMPGTMLNGMGGGTGFDSMYLPVVGCRSEGAGVGAAMAAVGITQTVNNDSVWYRHQSASMPNVAAAVHYTIVL